MADFRTPGSMCTTEPGGNATEGMSAHGTYAQPGSVNQEDGLTPEQQELALDIAQLTLDIVGIFEPTPFADGSNALISIARGDWLGAGLSGISMIPYIGDLAKAGKLPKYAQKLQRAIELAKTDPSFAKYLRPALEKIRDILNTIPDNLAPRVRQMVDSIKTPIDEFLGFGNRAAKRAKDLDALTDRLLIARLGSTKNVGTQVRENVKIIAEFLRKQGVSEKHMLQPLSGIDIHSPKGVIEVVPFKKGDTIAQYVDPQGEVGQWFVKVGSGTGPLDAGIAKGKRSIQYFKVTKSVELLKSKSAPVIDTWTRGAFPAHAPAQGTGVVRKTNTRVVMNRYDQIDITTGTAQKKRGDVSHGVAARGGGTQYFLPRMKDGSYNRSKTWYESAMELLDKKKIQDRGKSK